MNVEPESPLERSPWQTRASSGLLLALLLSACATPLEQRNLVEEYRKGDFGSEERFPDLNDAYRRRIALEFEIVRSGRIEPLREALHDSNKFVRALSVTALGILGDQASGGAIAKLLEDPEPMVSLAAIQALGLLKSGLEAVQAAKTNTRLNRRLVGIAERQITEPMDHAREIREAYRLGLAREDVGAAKKGMPAPDFSALDSEGRPFRLRDAVRSSKVVVLVFVSADW